MEIITCDPSIYTMDGFTLLYVALWKTRLIQKRLSFVYDIAGENSRTMWDLQYFPWQR